MEYVRNLDDLMLQINGVNPNEACMKVFNILFPFPDPLPLGTGEENTLGNFFDDMSTSAEEKPNQESMECLPEVLRKNIKDKEDGIKVEQAP